MVTVQILVGMALVAVLGVLIPAGWTLCLRRRLGGGWKPVLVGCGVFFLAAVVLEGLCHQLILGLSPAGGLIQGNVWLYALYGGLMAGLFEETGRFAAFRTLLRREEDSAALLYAAGHGGLEVFWLLTLTMGSYLALALGAGGAAVPEEVLAVLQSITPLTLAASVVERLSALALHTAFSVAVWFAAKDRRRLWLYPAAVLYHALADAIAVLMARFWGVWVTEVVLILIAACALLLAGRLWRQNHHSLE